MKFSGNIDQATNSPAFLRSRTCCPGSKHYVRNGSTSALRAFDKGQPDIILLNHAKGRPHPDPQYGGLALLDMIFIHRGARVQKRARKDVREHRCKTGACGIG
jgi:hypothetical protein